MKKFHWPGSRRDNHQFDHGDAPRCKGRSGKAVLGVPIGAVIALVLLAGCASVMEVERVSETTQLGRGGVAYSLPITHIRVAVPLEQSSIVVTRAATLSVLLLGAEPIKEFDGKAADKKAPQTTITSYAVGDGTQINTIGQPDPAQTFYARLKGGPFNDTNATVKLNNRGIMTKGTSEVENKTIDFAVSTIESVTKFAAKLIKPASAEIRTGTPQDENLLGRAAEAYELPKEALRVGLRIERLPSAEREQAIKAIKVTDPDLWTAWETYGKQVLKEINRAEALLKAIQRRKGLFDGLEAVPNPETLKFKLGELDAQIAKETSHFIGEEKKLPWTANFDYLPKTVERGVRRDYWETDSLLAIDKEGPSIWFSDRLLDRSPYPVAAHPRGDELKIVLHSLPLPAGPLATRLSSEPRRHGFPYRIPAETVAVAQFKGKQLNRIETRVAQHGIVAYLPRSLGSKKLKVDLDLEESSGSLTGLSTSTTAFDPGMISRIASASGEVVDARKAQAKADEQKNDPVNQLTRQKNLLQLQKDIRALEAEANREPNE